MRKYPANHDGFLLWINIDPRASEQQPTIINKTLRKKILLFWLVYNSNPRTIPGSFRPPTKRHQLDSHIQELGVPINPLTSGWCSVLKDIITCHWELPPLGYVCQWELPAKKRLIFDSSVNDLGVSHVWTTPIVMCHTVEAGLLVGVQHGLPGYTKKTLATPALQPYIPADKTMSYHGLCWYAWIHTWERIYDKNISGIPNTVFHFGIVKWWRAHTSTKMQT